MTTDVQLLRGGTFEDIPFTDFQIDLGISTQKTVPEASFTTLATEPVSAGQEARIVIDGVTRFRGICANSGRKQQGEQTVELIHDASELFSASVTFTEFGLPTDEDVLESALTSAITDNSYTLDYNGIATTLNNKYDAEGRTVKQIFQDMMDRTDKVWWTDPVDNIIHVGAKGGRGLWQALDTEADPGVEVRSFEAGTISTVRNTVTVTGTGEQATSGSATDTQSIDEYGQRKREYQVDYAITRSEAQALADELLQPEPIPEAELRVSQNVGDIVAPRINQTLDLDDATQDIAADDLLIERQIIEQGRATLSVGGGAGATVEDVNRTAKSEGDVTRPGSVYDTDRIADGAIETPKLVDLSISETKVQDNAISTPKLQANSVSANEIETNSITASEIDVLSLNTSDITIGNDTTSPITFSVETVQLADVTALHPDGDGLGFLGRSTDRFDSVFAETFNSSNHLIQNSDIFFGPDGTTQGVVIDDNGSLSVTVRPNTDNAGEVGTQSTAWAEMNAHNFNTQSPDPDVPSPDLSRLPDMDWYNPPEYATRRKAKGQSGKSYRRANPSSDGVELSHMANWLLETCKAQQERIDDLEERLSRLESQV